MPWDNYKAQKVCWAYVAGFTDGEGSIRAQLQRGNFNFQITLYQHVDAAWVLYEIQDFLTEHGIESKFYEAKRPLDKRHPTKGYYLNIRKTGHFYCFLKAIQPFSIVKAPTIKRVLKMIEEKKAAKPNHPAYQGWGD